MRDTKREEWLRRGGVGILLALQGACVGAPPEEPATPAPERSAHRAALTDASDPFQAPARALADELGFALNLQYAPWVQPGTVWRSFAAQHFNSYSNLGVLSQITLKNGANAPIFLDEIRWATDDARNPAYYSASQPFHLMRGHTNIWYGVVLPPWLQTLDAACTSSPGCLFNQPAWCSNGGTTDCNLPGMYAPNPAASLREHTLRRQVFVPVKTLRDEMGPGANIQVDVANEMVRTVFPWQDYSIYERLPGETDLAWWNRVAFPDSRVWSDIRPADRLYYLELAYRIAHAADPAARLFYNDYDGEVEGYGRKSKAIKELVRILRSRGTPVHGIGLQLHLKDVDPPPGYDHLGRWDPAYQPAVEAYMRGLAGIGVEAAVTEFDVVMKGNVANDEAVLRRHSRAARGVLDACVDSGNCHTFTAWGATEAAPPPATAASFSRGFFRSDLSPLPAWWALSRGLARAVVPGASVFEPEWFPGTPGHSATGGQPFLLPEADGYMFWGNGSLSAPVTIPVAGTYRYDFWARGYPAAGQDPIAELHLDSTLYGAFTVGAGLQHYAPEWVLPAGNHTMKVSFTNDAVVGSEDRNLFVDAVVLRPKHRAGRQECHPIQVATMGVKEGATLNDYGWGVLFTVGAYKEAVSVTKSGWYTLRLVGYGFGSPQQAALEMRVDGVRRTTWMLASQPWGSAGSTYEVNVYLERGTHELALAFTNDYTSGTEDLNVALGTLSVCPIFEQGGQVGYSASNTASATQNTVLAPVSLRGGQTLTFGACTAGTGFSGDTYLRLFNPLGVQVAANDNACGLGSQLTYTAPTSGTYTVRMGCASGSACYGNMAWSVQ
jgi:GH35 family endo-1,4-beta-xylanase